MKEIINEEDLISIPPAINFVKIEPKLTGCGNWAFGNEDILISIHKTLPIRVKVLTEWVYNNRPQSETNYYNVSKQGSVHLGCDCWRGEMTFQEFKRKITDAFYL